MGLESLPEVITVKELAEFLKVSDQTITRAIKNGKLEAFKLERNVRIYREDVEAWINSLNTKK